MTDVRVALKMERVSQFRRDAKVAAGSLDEIGAAGGRMAVMTSRANIALGRMKSAGVAMRRVGGNMTRSFTVPLLAIGYGATKLALSFDQDMTMIQTQAGASAGEVKNLRDQVLDLAAKMPQSPDEMAKGLYHLESVGLRGAKAMDALKIAAQGAMVGNANLEDTASALAGAWKVGIKGAGDFHHVMAILNATIGAGNMRMDDLTLALGKQLLTSAKVAGLGITDMTGALALLSDEGTPAASAAAQLGTALHFLYNPSAKAESALSGIGLSGKRLAEDMRKPRGLLVALRDLDKHMHGLSKVDREQVLGQIIPGGRGRVLLALLNQLDNYKSKMDQIEKTSGNFDGSVKTSQERPLNRLKSAWSTVQVALIRASTDALPSVASAFEMVAHVIAKLGKLFHGLPAPVKKLVVVLGLLLAVGGPILSMIGMMTLGIEGLGTALVFLSANPVVLIIAGVVALIAILVYAALHFDKVKRGVSRLGHIMASVGKTMWKGLKIGAEATLNWIIDRINTLIDALNSADGFSIAGHRIGAPKLGHVGHVDFTPSSPKRKVTPRDFGGMRVAGPGGTHVYLDGREVSAMVLKRSKDTARRK